MVKTIHAAAVLALLACNTGFDPQYRVTDLRILAVAAQVSGSTNADPRPGEWLALTALIANPLSRAPLTVSWFACPPLPDGRRPPCLEDEFQRDPVGLASAPEYGGRVLLIGNGPTPPLYQIPDPGTVIPGPGGTTYPCGFTIDIPLLVVAEAEGRREVALKTVHVVPAGSTYAANVNPTVDAVETDPTDQEACTGGQSVEAAATFPTGRTILCGHPGGGAAEDFGNCGKEALSWQWYVTAGTFPDVGGQGNAMGGAIAFQRPAGTFTLWGILRDGRGGVAWATRDVLATPQ